MSRKLVLFAALMLAAACGGSEEASPEFAEALPQVDGYMAEVTGDASEGLASTTSSLTGEYGQGESALLPTVSEYLVAARSAVASLNQGVRRALLPIVDLVKQNPQMVTGDVHVWGPSDRGNATYKFTMKKKAERIFGWKLEGKPVGADDAQYRVVMAGGIRVSPVMPNRGQGVMGIDADAFAAIDPDIKAAGKLFVGFHHGPNNGRALVYRLAEFTPDATKHQKVSAALNAVRGPNGRTAVRMGTYADISDPKNGTAELVLSRVRWLPTVGGRADGIVTLGDVPANHYYLVNSCWNAQTEEGFKRVRDCVKDQPVASCVEVRTVGDVANCSPMLPERVPNADPNAQEDDAAEEQLEPMAPPAAMPDGSGV